MLSSTFGSYVRWSSVARGKFTFLSYVASLILIYYTPPGRVVCDQWLVIFVELLLKLLLIMWSSVVCRRQGSYSWCWLPVYLVLLLTLLPIISSKSSNYKTQMMLNSVKISVVDQVFCVFFFNGFLSYHIIKNLFFVVSNFQLCTKRDCIYTCDP